MNIRDVLIDQAKEEAEWRQAVIGDLKMLQKESLMCKAAIIGLTIVVVTLALITLVLATK